MRLVRGGMASSGTAAWGGTGSAEAGCSVTEKPSEVLASPGQWLPGAGTVGRSWIAVATAPAEIRFMRAKASRATARGERPSL